MPEKIDTRIGFAAASKQWIVMLIHLTGVLIPVAALAAYSVNIATTSITREIDAENLALIQSVRIQALGRFDDRLSISQAMGGLEQNIEAARDRDVFTMNRRLQLIVSAADNEFERTFVVDTEGKPWAAYPTIKNEDYEESYAEYTWFIEVMETGLPTISSVYERVEKSTGKQQPFVSFAAPIYVDDELDSIIVLEYSARELNKWILDISDSGKIKVYVLDHNRNTVFHPFMDGGDARWDGIITDYRDLEVMDRIYASGTVASSTSYYDPVMGENMIATAYPSLVANKLWAIVAQQPQSIMDAKLNEIIQNVGFISVMLLATVVLIVILLGRASHRNIYLNAALSEKNAQLRKTDAIVRTSNDAIIGLDMDWTIKTWNHAAEELYGILSEDAVGTNFSDLIADFDEQSISDIETKLNSNEEVNSHEMTHSKADGSMFPASITLSRIIDEDGDPEGISAIVRDITVQKEVEQMKNDFISFVSHQLKAPVTAIKFILEGIMDGDDGPISPELEADVKTMQDVATGQFKLITDILNASRVERGVVELNREVVPVRKAVDRAIRDYMAPYQEKGLFLNVVEAEPNILVYMDTEKIAEAISNAVSNAWKYTEQGGITITISKQNGYAIVDVTDTGKGMDEEMLSKMFTRDKVMGSNTQAQGSSGLGLYIAKNFFTMHGGDIAVSSQVGVGTTFRYMLPLYEGEMTPEQ